MVIATNGGGGYEAGDIDNLALDAIQTYQKDKNNDFLLQQEIKNAALPDTSITTAESFPVNELNKKFLLDNNQNRNGHISSHIIPSVDHSDESILNHNHTSATLELIDIDDVSPNSFDYYPRSSSPRQTQDVS